MELSRTERHILKEMGFICHVEHPHKFISNYLATLETPPELTQEAWNLANDRCFFHLKPITFLFCWSWFLTFEFDVGVYLFTIICFTCNVLVYYSFIMRVSGTFCLTMVCSHLVWGWNPSRNLTSYLLEFPTTYILWGSSEGSSQDPHRVFW